VHLNLPFREPLLDAVSPRVVPRDETTSLNRPKTAALGTNVLSQLATRLDGRRGVIVAGARGAEQQVVAALAAHLRWPILADPLGGSRTHNPDAIRHADAWLRDAEVARNFTPEVVLRLGTLPASKVVNGWLRESGADIVAVSASPFLIDPDRRVSLHVVGDPATICADIMRVAAPVDAQWSERWQRAEAAARQIVAQTLDGEAVLSEPGVARTLVDALPANAKLVVSSSMPIRDVEWYAGACDHLVVHANRGVNGIDGVVSTAVALLLHHRHQQVCLSVTLLLCTTSMGCWALLSERWICEWWWSTTAVEGFFRSCRNAQPWAARPLNACLALRIEPT
jgi:2-succinyl-5-enolpyruvyl-6-hydroxy-3-cyclohexene-1-carboxylate synthase